MANLKKSGLLPGDIAIIFIVIFIAAAMLAVFAVSVRQSADTAVIYVDGEVFKKCPLDTDAVIEIAGYDIDMTIEISDGTVKVSRSNCKNQNCVKSGAAKMTNQIIACMPNGIYILIESKSNNSAKNFDAIIG